MGHLAAALGANFEATSYGKMSSLGVEPIRRADSPTIEFQLGFLDSTSEGYAFLLLSWCKV